MTVGWKRWACLAWLCLTSFAGNAVTPMIAAGYGESVFLHSDGSVWGTGSVTTYRAGAPSPVRLLQLPNVIAVSANEGATLALLADGTLWGSGQNRFGQLADGTTEFRSQPQRIPGISGVNAIASHRLLTLALKDDGTVWAWGLNAGGQLGDGTQVDRYVPGPVTGLANIKKISASGLGALALKADGTVWVWGATAVGAAGNGTFPSGDTDPEMHHLVPTQVHDLDQVIDIAAGFNHHMALRADGTVWTWGWGDLGENGIGVLTPQALPVRIPGLDHVVAIDAKGWRYSLALKDDGTVWAWGSNNFGQLGVSGMLTSAVPIRVPGLSDIVAISAGQEHVLAMQRDGKVLAWGVNSNGQLGDGTLQNRPQPLPVSAPGGSGQFNLLQPLQASFNQLPGAQISLNTSSGRAPLTVQANAVGVSDPDGSVGAFLWKSSDNQQATGPSATFVFTQAGSYQIDLLIEDNAGGRGHATQRVVVAPAAVSVSATPKVGMGRSGSIALTNDGRLLTWGASHSLGLYDPQTQSSLPQLVSRPIANGIIGAVDFSIGSAVLALLADGTVLGWGLNFNGEVGSDSQANTIEQPQRLSNLPPVQALASGWNHSLALTRDRRVFVWGSNNDGQLGLGDNNIRYQPAEIAGLSNVISVAAGRFFSVALKADGTVWAWGSNSGIPIGGGTALSRNTPIQVPGLVDIRGIFLSMDAVFAQKSDGTVWVTGYLPTAFSGDPGPSPGPRHLSVFDGVVQVAGGSDHVIALKADGTVWTGGSRSALALGFPDSGVFSGLKQVPGISDAIGVAAGTYSSMVLRRDGTILSWGLNNVGQIGDGTLALQQTPVLVINETADGFLDLIPEVANIIPRNRVPPFFISTYANGGRNSTTLYADLKGITLGGAFAASNAGRFAAAYNVYVAANVPTVAASPYFQLNANNSWSTLNWPMAEFMRNVALDSQNALVRAQILQNADLSSPALAGASVIVGYGTDPDEMLKAARYRTIFTVPQQ